VVHVATHGVLAEQNPMFSRIEMARGEGGPDDDGRFEVHEVLGLTAASRLVFLSGCETGSGAAGNAGLEAGEDYATLARAFLYAGVGNVVATLWRIEDEGAAAFAREFYGALASRPPAEALAEAQRKMVAQGRYRAPFYWAAYRLDGTG
jgi:CHAT domain-containing protein